MTRKLHQLNVSKAFAELRVYLPSVKFCYILLRLPCTKPVTIIKVVKHPFEEMIFESPFDHLVQQVRGEKLMDVGAREVFCEGLHEVDRQREQSR